MLMASINTNPGAMTALRVLNATRDNLAVAQSRLNTGRAVNSTKDNAANWVIAQDTRGDIVSLEVIQTSLARAQSIVDVSLAAGEQVMDLLLQMKERALGGKDAAITTASRTALNNDFVALRQQIKRLVEEAEFDGFNLIKDGAENLEVMAGIGVDTEVVQGGGGGGGGGGNGNGNGGNGNGGASKGKKVQVITIGSVILALSGPNVVLAAGASFATAAEADAVLSALNTSIANAGDALSTLGAAARRIESNRRFIGRIQDALHAGVGNLVDADLARESARLRALQTREQLGAQALAIANGAPRTLLRLFEARAGP